MSGGAGDGGRPPLYRGETVEATSLPIYYQLYLTLRERLRDGGFPRDAPLPSEAQLAARFRVSRVTVRRTLHLLEQDGLVVRRRGIGTFPRTQEAVSSEAHPVAPLANLITAGLDSPSELLNWSETATPPPRIAEALGIAGNASCLMIERLRRHAGQPFSLTTLWIATAVAPLVARQAIDDAPIVELIERAGRPAATADQSLSAQLAGDHAARLLDVAIGAPLLSLRRVVRDRDGDALLYQHSLYDPGRTEYAMRLERDDAGPRAAWTHIG